MTTALPIDRPWYRQLLAIAVAMGLVIGLLGLVYLGITGALTDRIFGDPRIDTWSGDWWWIPFTAAGGLVAAAVRSWLKITDHVPGGVAVIESDPTTREMNGPHPATDHPIEVMTRRLRTETIGHEYRRSQPHSSFTIWRSEPSQPRKRF